jgi:hypothetical protein
MTQDDKKQDRDRDIPAPVAAPALSQGLGGETVAMELRGRFSAEAHGDGLNWVG